MVNVKSVRQSVPAQTTPLIAGAAQGFGKFFEVQQAKKAQEQENMMSILPALASIRALQPAMEGEEGAIDMGGGNYLKIVTPQQTSQDKLADARTKQVEYSMSAKGQAAEATIEFQNDNAIMLDGQERKKKGSRQKIIDEFYASALKTFGDEESTAGGTVPVFNPKTGETAMAPPDVAAQLIASGEYTSPPGDQEEGGGLLGPVAKGLIGLPAAAGAMRMGFKALPHMIKGGGRAFGPWGMGASALATGGLMLHDYMNKNKDASNINQAAPIPVTPQQQLPMPVPQQAQQSPPVLYPDR